jgi:hypothetical protein
LPNLDFEALAGLKDVLDPKELRRFSDRRQGAQDNEEFLECMVDRTLHGASSQFRVLAA